MTLPHERARCIIWGREFLLDLVNDEAVAPDVRAHCSAVLQHYPSAVRIALG